MLFVLEGCVVGWFRFVGVAFGVGVEGPLQESFRQSNVCAEVVQVIELPWVGG